MTDPLQSFDWKSSNYERPAGSWVCGRMCEEGLPCRLGPSNKGECQVQGTCEPEERGGKYLCTRSVLNGGKCKEGPSADGTCCQVDNSCAPRRSLLARRRLLGGIAAFFAASICLGMFSGDAPSPRLSPGEVTQSHAIIESNCSACHSAAEGSLDSWIQHAMSGETALEDSARCLKCHTELGQDALFAHSVSVDQLQQMTSQVKASDQSESVPLSLKLASWTGQRAANDKLACSTCHQEHHGRNASLTQLTDLQCQSCHTQQFHSFQHGHPDLGDYPYLRRSRIYFDHNAHLNRYFKHEEFKRTMPNGQVPESCNSCHTPDASGRLMLTSSFEKTCASCHEPQIDDVEFPGVPFFALPVFDHDLMKSHGGWPNTMGTFHSKNLPQLMELLLQPDPEYQSALKQLGSIDYRKLKYIDSKNAAAVTKIAWAIKRLLYEISISGEAAIKRRLGENESLYLQLNPSIVPSLTQAQQLWFPDLAAQIKEYQQNEKQDASDTRTEATLSLSDAAGTNSGWSISNADFTVRYRPLGHADPLIKGWLDRAVQQKQAVLDQDSLWQIFSNPTASGTEDSHGPLASGRCLMCHSVDQDPASGLTQINWQPRPARQPEIEAFTQFSHAPHLSTGRLEKCEDCHAFSETVKNHPSILQPDYFVRNASNQFWQINENSRQTCTSGFEPISRQQCATCHNDQTQNQSCLQCHNYHTHR